MNVTARAALAGTRHHQFHRTGVSCPCVLRDATPNGCSTPVVVSNDKAAPGPFPSWINDHGDTPCIDGKPSGLDPSARNPKSIPRNGGVCVRIVVALRKPQTHPPRRRDVTTIRSWGSVKIDRRRPRLSNICDRPVIGQVPQCVSPRRPSPGRSLPGRRPADRHDHDKPARPIPG